MDKNIVVNENAEKINSEKGQYEAPKIKELSLIKTRGGAAPGLNESTTTGTIS